MKIRVTLMTENDKHVDVPEDELRATAEKTWNWFLSTLSVFNEDLSDKATVESVEIVEK